MRLVPERAALVAALLADRAALAVTAATVGRLMAASRLVAMAAMEFWLVMAARRVAMAARRWGGLGAPEGQAAMAELAAPCTPTPRTAAIEWRLGLHV